MLKLNNSEKRTRQRGKNFSPSEEDTLLRLLKPYKHIIENKKSDAMTCQMKKDAWEQLAQEFNQRTGMHRTWRTLKDKYKNMNTKIKTEGKQLVGYSINPNEDFDLSISSCVSVVYERNEEEDEITPDLDYPMDIKEEEIQSPRPEGVQMDFPAVDLSPSEPDEEPEITTNNRKRSLNDDRLELFRLQQKFYQNENLRSAKRHRLEVKNLNLKSQILELELEERRKRLERKTEIIQITPS